MSDAPHPESTPARRSLGWRTLVARLMLVGFIGFLVAATFQRRLLFYNWGPVLIKFPPSREVDHDDVWIKAGDGVSLNAWYSRCPTSIGSPIAGERPVVLFFHGSAGDVHRWRWVPARWQDAIGADVLVVDYRGYGRSGGTSSEAGLYEDSLAAYNWLVKEKGVDPRRIVIVGQSLGGGVATQLATRVEHRMLVLESTFASIPEVVDSVFFGLPAGHLMVDVFPSEARLANYRKPLFLSHGTRDHLIPFSHSERLQKAAKGPTELMVLEGMGHTDRRTPKYVEAVRDFIVKHWND